MTELSSVFTSVKSHERLSDQVLLQIESAIISGKLVPGQRLPSERKLSEIFGVGRSVVREATRALEQKGLVAIRHGLGVFVSPNVDHVLSETLRMLITMQDPAFLEVYEVRSVLEVATVAFVAQRATEEDFIILQYCLTDMESANKNNDVAQYVAADLAFHLALGEASHNKLFPILFKAFAESLGSFTVKTVTGVDELRIGLEQHRRIFNAVKNGDREEGARSMRQHLHSSIVQHQDSTAPDYDAEVPLNSWLD
ncbi:MAG: FadR family transcriptional regulator [Anaerolineae bacterium]|nr:FadR family transcriptional regulator [Anaerolineae bacterium]